MDKLGSLCSNYGVMSLPTFMAFKNAEKIGSFKGASTDRLMDMVQNNGKCSMAEQSNVDYPRLAMFVVLIIYMFYKNGYFEALKAYF